MIFNTCSIWAMSIFVFVNVAKLGYWRLVVEGVEGVGREKQFTYQG